MPLYQFYCQKCKSEREVKCTMSEHSLIKENIICECGEKMVQCVSAVPFGLVGDGWYASGYHGTKDTKKELENELRVYDKHRDKQAQEKYDFNPEE